MAIYVADYTQSDESIILGLINNDNGTTFTPAQIIFGAAASAGDVGNVLKTTLTITAATGSGYRGSQTFNYNRVPMSFMNDLDPSLVLVSDELTTHDLLAYLNEHFGVNFTEADVVLENLPEFEPDVETDFTFTATADSKIFHGSATLKGTAPTIELASVLTLTDLDGLYPPAEMPVV